MDTTIEDLVHAVGEAHARKRAARARGEQLQAQREQLSEQATLEDAEYYRAHDDYEKAVKALAEAAAPVREVIHRRLIED